MHGILIFRFYYILREIYFRYDFSKEIVGIPKNNFGPFLRQKRQFHQFCRYKCKILLPRLKYFLFQKLPRPPITNFFVVKTPVNYNLLFQN